MRFLLAFFLTAIAVVPIVEWAGVRARERREPPPPGHACPSFPVRSVPTLPVRPRQAGRSPGLWRLVVSTNRIAIAGLSGFERALEAESLLGRSLRPPAQVVMTGWLGVGNERVYRGRDGWLFYRPDVEYITGRGFLDPAQLRRRVAAAPEWTAPPQPDPREAIAQFRRDLEARGITLVVMPTPLKPGVHPEMLARRYADATGALQNPSYRAFVDDLRRDGVLVFDPSEALAAARRSGPQYLATDTHWRPETMEGVAELLGGFIAAHVRLPVTADPGYRIERPEVRNTGDVARMLDLPDDGPLFPPEAVWLRRVLQPDGSPWRSSRDADVLRARRQLQQHLLARVDGLGHLRGLRRAIELRVAAAGRSPRAERRGRVRHARHAAAGSRSARREASGRLPVRRARAGVRRLESDPPARAAGGGCALALVATIKSAAADRRKALLRSERVAPCN